MNESEEVLFRPTEAHLCGTLGRWVRDGDEPYTVPFGIARRKVRAGLGEIVLEDGEASGVAPARQLDLEDQIALEESEEEEVEEDASDEEEVES